MVCGGGSMCQHGRRKSRCKEGECGKSSPAIEKKHTTSKRRVPSHSQEIKPAPGTVTLTPPPLPQRAQPVTPEHESVPAELKPEAEELPRFSFQDPLSTSEGSIGADSDAAFSFLAAPVAQPMPFQSVLPTFASTVGPDEIAGLLLWSRWHAERQRQVEEMRRQDQEARAWEQLKTLFEDIPI